MRAVYDTNVLISIFLSNGVPKKVFMRVLKGDVGLLLSEQLLSEFKGVISRKKFGFSKEDVMRMTDLLQKAGYIVEPRVRLNHIKDDPDDDRVLECAVAGNAGYIVSGDRHLLDLGEFRGIKIVTAAKFLEHLE